MRHKFRQAGFTLIELLAVVVIILILAGIVLGLVKFANDKAARAKAETEMAAMSTALESYKTDNGTYPKGVSDGTTPSITGVLNARLDFKPQEDRYKKASAILYRALSGDPGSSSGSSATNFNKVYWNPPETAKSSANTTALIDADGIKSRYFVDPFGNTYGYSTAYDEAQAIQAAGTTTTPITVGFNPTFDLWSTSGYGLVKSYPVSASDPNNPSYWIKNW